MAAAVRSSSSGQSYVAGRPHDQFLVLVHLDAGGGGRDGVGQRGPVAGAGDDDVLDGRQVGEERRDERQQGTVHEDDAVGGVVDDPDELLGRETEVERVEDGPHGGDREVCLDMIRVVPHERRDALVTRDTEFVAQGAA